MNMVVIAKETPYRGIHSDSSIWRWCQQSVLMRLLWWVGYLLSGCMQIH